MALGSRHGRPHGGWTDEARTVDRGVSRSHARGGRRLGGANGFETLEIACWPRGGGEKRRYAGVSHIDAERLDAGGAAAVRELLAARGLEISSLAYYPNHLHPDARTAPRSTRTSTTSSMPPRCSASRSSARSWARDPRALADREPALLRRGLARRWSIARAAKGVKIAIENCPMLFSGDEWPFGTNLARTPHIWREMFNVDPGRRLRPQPRPVAPRLADDRLRARGLRLRRPHPPRARQGHGDRPRRALRARRAVGRASDWQMPRLPGLGEVRWDRFCSALYARRLRPLDLDRARGSRLRGRRRSRQARVPDRSRRAAPYVH